LACGPREEGERARLRVGLGLESGRDTRRVGDDKGGHPLVAAGAGGGEAGWRQWLLGRLGQAQGWAAMRWSGSRPASGCRLN
jgi:hypothetical protein